MVKIGFMVLENFRTMSDSPCSFEHVLFCVLLENKFSFKFNFKVEPRTLMKRENKEKLFSFNESN